MAPNVTIVGHYGPTEATVGMLTYRVEKDQIGHCSLNIPMGRPLPNTQAYLLDSYLQPIPIGTPAELHIDGTCLARCYLYRPEITAEKFIPNPFSNQPGARLYKTGDLACYFPDGNIEFLGRSDHQVKIRGYRIELGEIETALLQNPKVREAVVVAQTDAFGDMRLVAYLVAEQEQTLMSNELRSHLKEKLPDYMVPLIFVILDVLPQTPLGKIDRKALPTPKLEELSSEIFIAPGSPVEEDLATIWASLLGLSQVGINDNFFELGGHSLLATQIISRIRKAFSLDIPLRSLFENPTIREFAERIDTIRWAKEGRSPSLEASLENRQEGEV